MSNNRQVEVMEATAIAEITRGEVDAQVATAKKYPRDLKRFVANVKEAALSDPEIAAGCTYSLPRDGKNIQGPAIDLAEIVLQQFGNLRAGSRIVEVGERTVKAQALAWDLENNVMVTSEVQRRIVNRQGKRYNDDMIIVTSNAACAIALRNVVFKVVPWSLIKDTYTAALTMALPKMEDVQKLYGQAVKYLAEMKVTETQVLTLLKRKAKKEVTQEDILTLRSIAGELRRGDSTTEDIFGNGKAERLAAATDESEAEIEPEGEDTSEKTDPEPAEENTGKPAQVY